MHGEKLKKKTFNLCLLEAPAQSIFHLRKFNLKLVYGEPNGSFQCMYGRIEGFVGTLKDEQICRWM